ncbi:Zn-ribbon domain-containing OB-fold protein [Blastococcus sp. PRF04-17]|uniref:Zn-ribbon domain-containing OB-fold protein n=1 Tax=Blastococcus sp. PRF04-17 TaxID=2933797 RepID=UPI001FF3D6BA|nr:zinc ribbon domain-containing protein [Blastococcus sp. PRF04-17]UOY02613.1 zinc ribbon domain-containing protein [Blastococcus sp. PRF04-17]
MSAATPVDWTRGEPRLVVTRCDRCGARWYLPRERCPNCGSREATPSAAGGGGLCVAVTRLHASAQPAETAPLGLVLVELDEGPLVMGRMRDDALAPGDRARVVFLPDSGDGDPARPGDTSLLVPSFAREGST